MTSILTIHSCYLWTEVFGTHQALGRDVPEDWEKRSVALLRALPLHCRDRQLIVALLTLPLGEADKAVEASLEASRNASVILKKSRGSGGAVSLCMHDILKWPAKEIDIAHAIHQGDFCRFLSSRKLSCEHFHVSYFWQAYFLSRSF